MIGNLSSLRMNENEPKRLELYDFKRANRLTREQARLLMRIYEQLARSSSTAISARLQRPTVIRVKSVQQLTYGEFVYSLPNPTAVAIYRDKLTDQPVLIQQSCELALSMYDRLCGGNGSTGQNRDLTEIECSVLSSQVFQLIVNGLERAWAGLLTMELEYKSLETSLLYMGVMPDRDVVVVGTFEVSVGGSNDLITICCPYALMENVLGRSIGDLLYRQHTKQTRADTSWLQKLVQLITVDVEVILGEANVGTGDLAGLEIGDVITLNRRVDEPLEVRVGGIPKFEGRPGLLGRRLAVVIERRTVDKGA
ncbi:MAG TPA: hypothetical protein GXX40_08475 [Firmicutes bacterium]|nr:hypothetical protein [Bacillota bacterium]